MVKQGDIVQFSGPMMLVISQKYPVLFARMQETGRCHGQVMETADDHVVIDFDISGMKPVVLNVDPQHPEGVLMVVRKADLTPPATPPTPPTPTPPPPSASTPLASLPYPPDVEDDYDGEFHPTAAMTPLQYAQTAMREGGGRKPKITGIPETVALSQWVMVQFLGFKEQAIIQDLRRTPDHLARYPHPQNDMENWQRHDQELRAVQADLTPEEEQLYATALRRLRNWIEPPVVTHPENTPSSDG